MNTARANMPNYYAAETEARSLIEAKLIADQKFYAGLADPLIRHFIKRLCPVDEPHEITGGKQL